MKITIFKNIKETSTPFVRDVSVILERIRDGKSKDLVDKIRKEKDKEKRNLLKQGLPAICFSGIFTRREDKAIENHSGLICLDFDGFKTKKAMMEKKAKLTKDTFVYSIFVSPSGNGIKVLVKIPAEPSRHCDYFVALEKYFGCDEFDTSCKNISRVCYESYDSDIFIREKSKLWDSRDEEEDSYMDVATSRPTIHLSDDNEVVRRLLKWWDGSYGLVDGERNNNMFILASSFNKFGVNKSLSHYILGQYSTNGFGGKEIGGIVESAYRNTHEFNTKFFEDVGAVENIKHKIKQGTSPREIKQELKDSGVEDDEVDGVIEELRTDSAKIQFWRENERGNINIVHHLFKEFLEDSGIYKYSPEGSTAVVFVRVTDNLISNISAEQIKDLLLTYLYDRGDMMVYNHFADKTRYFKEDFLGMLTSIDAFFIIDTKATAYLYYRNCAVKVTRKGVEMIDYIDLGGYVWKDQVIDRDFDIDENIECDYRQFIHNVAGDKEQNIRSIESTIGFLLHGYKSHSYCPAVIINDEIISESPEGGTGKGLFVKGISHMKNVVTIDGKAFHFEKSFAYQLVSQDTQTLCFDDVRKSFHFERLFSVVTEGITLEKKNKDAIKIPFEYSPKIVITTNYAIIGKGNSFARRKWELEFTQFYHKNFTPLDEFGRLLFSDWDSGEWCRFDNYMIGCLKEYLNVGFVESEFKNMDERKFQAATNPSFYVWLQDYLKTQEIQTEVKIYVNSLWFEFTSYCTDYDKLRITRMKFDKWLEEYAYHRTGISATVDRDRSGKFMIINEKIEESAPF